MEIFCKEENQIILDNPLGINKREDKLTWPLTEMKDLQSRAPILLHLV